MDVFTLFSGKINLNTAPPPTLQMLPGVDANIGRRHYRRSQRQKMTATR